MSYPYDDGTAETEAANINACIAARRAAGLPEIPDVTEIDCDCECAIYNTSCPLKGV